VDELVPVTCPYCGEESEIAIEPDLRGTFVQDCEICCNPWLVRIALSSRAASWGQRATLRQPSRASVTVTRADGSE
jgi:Cysteine-rich CPXCG